MICSKKRIIIFLTLAAAAGIAVILTATRWGNGSGPDSIAYIHHARNLLAGKGYTLTDMYGALTYQSNFPPLYSGLLALPGIFGAGVLESARYLNAVLLGMTVFCSGAVIFAASGSALAAGLTALVVLFSKDLLELHAAILSEPLFLFLTVSGLGCLVVYVRTVQKKWAVISAACLSLAVLTRYAGAALPIAGAFVMLSLEGSAVVRLKKAALFFGGSIFPAFLWMVRNRIVSGDMTGRGGGIEFHPVTADRWIEGVKTVGGWFLPEAVPPMVRGLFALVFLSVLLAALWRGRHSLSPETRVFGTFAVTYFIFVTVYISFVTLSTPLDARILSPVYLSLVLLVVPAAARSLLSSQMKGLYKTGVILLVGLFLGTQMVRAAAWTAQYYERGPLGYGSRVISQSALLSSLKTIPQGTLIFTNDPYVLYWHTGKSSGMIPAKRDPNSRRPLPEQEVRGELTKMVKDMATGPGVLVYFKYLPRWYLLTEEDLNQLLPIKPIQSFPEGTVYVLSPESASRSS